MLSNSIIVVPADEMAQMVKQAAADGAAQAMAELRKEILLPGSGKEPLIDRAELARRLDVTPQTIISLERKRKIKSYRVGDAARYSWEEVKAALLYNRK